MGREGLLARYQALFEAAAASFATTDVAKIRSALIQAREKSWCEYLDAAAPQQPPVPPSDDQARLAAFQEILNARKTYEENRSDAWFIMTMGALTNLWSAAPAVLPVETPPAEKCGEKATLLGATVFCAREAGHPDAHVLSRHTPPPVQPDDKRYGPLPQPPQKTLTLEDLMAAVQPGAPTETPARQKDNDCPGTCARNQSCTLPCAFPCDVNHSTTGCSCAEHMPQREHKAPNPAPAAVQPVMGERCECGHGKDEHVDLRFGCKHMDDVEGIVSFCKCQKFKRPAQPTPGDAEARPVCHRPWCHPFDHRVSASCISPPASAERAAASPPRRRPEELADQMIKACAALSDDLVGINELREKQRIVLAALITADRRGDR